MGFLSIGSLLSGYTLSYQGQLLNMPAFFEALGLESDPDSPSFQSTISTINGVFFVGCAVGGLFAAVTFTLLGRVRGLQIACVTQLLGAALLTGAGNEGTYLAGRVFSGIGAGQFLSQLGPYMSELSPPNSRGFQGGLHGSLIGFGFTLSGWVGFGCFYARYTQFGWRFPCAVMLVLTSIISAGTFWLPESPRWLIFRDRNKEASDILRRLHKDPNDPEDSFAWREFYQIKEAVEYDTVMWNQHGWREIFGKAYRKRLFLACLFSWGTQSLGPLVIQSG